MRESLLKIDFDFVNNFRNYYVGVVRINPKNGYKTLFKRQVFELIYKQSVRNGETICC